MQYIRGAKNGYTEEINNESLIGEVSKINESGQQEITVNGVTYSANVIVENNDLVLDGEKEVQGATLSNKVYEFGNANYDVATASENAKNMVILKVNGNLTINSNITLTACKSEQGYGGPKGLFIYVTGTLTNNGIINMTARGAKAEGQDVYLWQNTVYEDENEKYEYILAQGGNGADLVSKYHHNGGIDGKKGTDGTKRQTGGGGSGSAQAGEYDWSYSGAGSAGTSYSGGTGGGAMDYDNFWGNLSFNHGKPGNLNGGSGGDGYGQNNGNSGGGSGNPGRKKLLCFLYR